MRGRAAIALLGLALAACGIGAHSDSQSAAPLPTWPVAPERLGTRLEAAPDARLTCGFPDRTFQASALDNPTGAEKESGPLFDALRAAFARFDFDEDVSHLGWLAAQQDQSGTLFLAHTDSSPPAWWYVLVTADGPGYTPAGMGGCNLNVQISKEYGPAHWAPDPAYAPPDASTTELHILVWEIACSGASPTTGRMSAPVVEYAAGTITITIGVRPLTGSGAITCPLGPGTPAIVTLPQPMGDRTLLDGYVSPPVAPSPPF